MKRARAALARDVEEQRAAQLAVGPTFSSDLLRFLVGRWASTAHFTSKDVCLFADRITQAGGRGVEALSVSAGARGDNFNRKLKRALKLQGLDDQLYFMDVPLWDSNQDERTRWFPVQGLMFFGPSPIQSGGTSCGGGAAEGQPPPLRLSRCRSTTTKLVLARSQSAFDILQQRWRLRLWRGGGATSAVAAVAL